MSIGKKDIEVFSIGVYFDQRICSSEVNHNYKSIIFFQKLKGFPGIFQKRIQIILSQHSNVENAFWDGHEYKSHKRNRKNTKKRIENAKKKSRKHGSEFWLMNRWMFSSSIIGPDAWCVGFEQQALLAQWGVNFYKSHFEVEFWFLYSTHGLEMCGDQMCP